MAHGQGDDRHETSNDAATPLHRRGVMDPAQLRAAATRAATETPDPDAAADPNLQELRIHRIELEMQHEQLQQAHADLQEAHRQFESLFRDAPLAYVKIGTDWRIDAMNCAASRLLKGIVVGQEFLAVQFDGQLVHFLASLKERTRVIEMPLRTSTGVFFARLSGRRTGEGFLIAIQDVTEARNARNALAAAKQRMDHILDAAPDAIAVLYHDRLLFANRSLCQLLGRSQRELYEQPFEDHLVTGTPRITGRSNQRRELSLIDSDGTPRVMECRPVEIEYDGRIAVLLILRDLTERRHAEARLAQSDRLAQVGLLIAGVAHELNNPLTYILGNLDVLVEVLQPPGLRRMAAEAQTGVRRLANIVGDLRTFQHSDDALEEVRVNDIVAGTIRVAEPKIALQTRISRDLGRLPTIVASSARLGQVLLNLILNAAHAMPDRPPAQNRVRVRTFATPTEVCIQVEDNGRGISEEDQRHIFDPFFTTRKSEGGSGLGLAVSNSLIQQLGGFIEVQSTTGRGSRFTIRLPLTREPVRATPTAAPARNLPSPARRLKIMVVDDEVSIARLLERMLARFGDVQLVGSGNAAIRRLAAGERYDVILSDLIMDNGTGDDLGAWLTENLPQQARRFALMSGMPHPGHGPRGRVIKKPFDFDEVYRVVQEIADLADTPPLALVGQKR